MFIAIIILLLFSKELVSSERVILNKLTKVDFSQQYDFQLQNGQLTSVLIEIFSPSVYVNVFYSKGKFLDVLQASIFIPINTVENIRIQTNVDISYFWYRVINTNNVVPINYPRNQDFQMKTIKNYWNISIEFLNAEIVSKYWIVPKHYNVWIFPIYPDGQLGSWGTDFFNINEDLIMSKVNSSLEFKILKQRGILVGTLNNSYGSPTMKFTFVNRKTYTNLIIIEAVFNTSFSMQYPPVIIYGCKSNYRRPSMGTRTLNWSKKDTCYVINDRNWQIVIMCIVGFIILFTFIGVACENLLSLIFTWIVLSYIFGISAYYIFKDRKNTGNIIYFASFGIAAVPAVLVNVLVYISTLRDSFHLSLRCRIRIIFNVLCIIVILYHILWFILQTFLSYFGIVLGLISSVSIILFFTLLYFHEITITFGNIFISISTILFGISSVVINSSSFSYLFLDFLYYILYRDNNVKYYTYFLLDDLFIFVSWGLVTTIGGILFYKIYKRRSKQEKSNTTEPNFNQGSFINGRFSDNLDSRLGPYDRPPPPYTPRATDIELHNIPLYS